MRHQLCLAILFISVHAFSQANTKKIRILDQNTNQPLIGASISCQGWGTITDDEGTANIDLDKCPTFQISYLGYNTIYRKALDIKEVEILTVSDNTLDAVTVTGSRYERRLSETTVSVEVLKPGLMNSINVSKADEAMNKLPGVQVVGGQANIRGGSGFSYGAGSRVMVLMDDLPALQTDAGFANWGDMPIEHIDQIEVLKGAASALYGSSALNGIINFRRVKPTSKPSFKIFSAYTEYGDPKERKSIWWTDRRYRLNNGISYAQKIENLDLGLHGFYSKLESFNQSTFENRFRVGTNLAYRVNDKLTIGLNGIINRNDGSDFFIWQDAIRNIYKPFTGTISSGVRTRAMIDPYLKYVDGSNSHKLQSRVFYTNNDQNNNQSNKSLTRLAEYQYQTTVDELDLVATGGVYYSATSTDAELLGDNNYLYQNAAGYVQIEKTFDEKISTSFGLRYEYNNQQSPETFMGITIPGGNVKDGAMVARAGVNYKLAEYSSLRASWGQGYRYPTVTERFISTQFGGFSILPNPILNPEFGFSTELGLKQGVKIGGLTGFVDIAGFWQEYSDMIEFTFLTSPSIGFKPINVGNTRITGGEVSFIGQFKIGQLTFNTLNGYTLINPIYKDFETNDQVKSSVSAGTNTLKYRSRHSFKTDIEGSWKWISLGMSYQQYSHQENIDKQLEEPFVGVDQFEIKAFRRLNPNGFNVLDFRGGLKFKGVKASIIMANYLNKLYTVRPGLAEAPKNFTIRLDWDL